MWWEILPFVLFSEAWVPFWKLYCLLFYFFSINLVKPCDQNLHSSWLFMTGIQCICVRSWSLFLQKKIIKSVSSRGVWQRKLLHTITYLVHFSKTLQSPSTPLNSLKDVLYFSDVDWTSYSLFTLRLVVLVNKICHLPN